MSNKRFHSRESRIPNNVASMPRPVNIIVPIFSGVEETFQCLTNLLASDLPNTSHVTLIDDRGPDDGMAALLQGFGKTRGVTVLRNPVNLGFVASVNRGMTFLPDHDPLLLNSDTLVPSGWVQRLQRCVYSSADIGTSTPFSNNATICSYPRFCASNPLPEGLSLTALDFLFQKANNCRQVDIPTAVGFCMLIRRECLDTIGLFDEKHFGKGYGEENDFCMRAASQGWRHVLCADTFVYHAGSVSFKEEQHTRAERAYEILRQLHPTYPSIIQRHILDNPARPLRQRVDLLRLQATNKQVILFVSHDLAGGVLRNTQELATQYANDAEFMLLRSALGGQIEISWMRRGESLCLFFHQNKDWDALRTFLRALGLCRIHFHHSLHLPEAVWKLPEACGVPYDVSIHDFFAICPRINLVDHSGGYCQEPEETVCNRCLASTPGAENDIESWRGRWRIQLARASRVFAPSQDVANRLHRYFPEVSIIVAPHADITAPMQLPVPHIIDENEPLKIVTIGALSQIKGGGLLEACAQDSARRKLPLRFYLIGYAWRQLSAPEDYLEVTGEYREEELPALIEAVGAQLAWFPALWPETYCYALSAALQAGLPVAVTNLGALPERVAGRTWSWSCNWQWTAREWNDFFLEIRSRHFMTNRPPSSDNISATAPLWNWQRDYLIADTRITKPDILDVLLSFADHHSEPRLSSFKRCLLIVRRAIISKGLRLRSHPLTGHFVDYIPLSWQNHLRGWIIGQR